MEKPLKISVVSPVYKAENIVDKLCSRISEEITKITSDYEIILVEDGSPDNSWDKIKKICEINPKIKAIKLSKNFGQHYAISACLDFSQGDYVILMDCDLQDNPKYISFLIKKAKEGYDIVYTSKNKRRHNFIKNVFAFFFYKLFNYLSRGQSAELNIGAYSLISRKVVNTFKEVKDYHRHYLMILKSLGFRSSTIYIDHEKRFEGESSYNFSKLLKHAINGITSQSDKLLKLSISIGLILFLISIFWSIFLIYQYYNFGAYPGYTSIMVFMQLSTGLILMSVGIMGVYIGKIFEQVKEKPLYIIDEKINLE